MRIKISVDNSYIYQSINIQNITFKNNEKLPTIYFKCHKRFEKALPGETLIFHNYEGKEIFSSANVKLDYKYYEADRYKEQKVRFVVRDIEFENYGKVSNHYMLKILKTTCNAKIITPQPQPQRKQLTYGEGVMRYIEQIKAMKYKVRIYRKRRKRYIVNQVIEKIYNTRPASTAPT